MENKYIRHVPARLDLARDLVQVSFGHTRIVLECHRIDPLAIIEVPHRADEHGRSAKLARPVAPVALVIFYLVPGIKWMFAKVYEHAVSASASSRILNGVMLVDLAVSVSASIIARVVI